MDDNVNKCICELANFVFRKKFGENLIVKNKLNYSAMGAAASTFMNKDKVNVEIRKSSQLEGSDSDIEFDDGKIIINNGMQAYVEFMLKIIINEFDTINSSLNFILSGQHDDRVAEIISAQEKYEEARHMNKINGLEKMKDAESTLINGVNKLEKEIQRSIKRIKEIPKSKIAKIFGAKIKIQDIDEIIKNTRDSLLYYKQAIVLKSILNYEFGEVKSLSIFLEKRNNFLNEVLTEENCNRMNEFDVNNDNYWLEEIYEIFKCIDGIKNRVGSDNQIYLLSI